MADGQIFHDMTISNTLERVDLLNFMFEEDGGTDSSNEYGISKDHGSGKEVINSTIDPVSAFLGPKLWNNYDAMTLEDLMAEDGGSYEAVALSDIFYKNSEGSPMVTSSPEVASPTISEHIIVQPALRPCSTIIVPPTERSNVNFGPNFPSGPNEFLYVESKKAKIDREKVERKRKLEVLVEFAPEDIALASVPGVKFDPKTRTFEMEELRPQPIIKKRKKKAITEEAKDEKYWEMRLKNMEASRRSREAKRIKDNQIMLRAAHLEKENKLLKEELDAKKLKKSKLETDVIILKRKLQMYDS